VCSGLLQNVTSVPDHTPQGPNHRYLESLKKAATACLTPPRVWVTALSRGEWWDLIPLAAVLPQNLRFPGRVMDLIHADRGGNAGDEGDGCGQIFGLQHSAAPV